MKKFLFITDSHIREDSPRWRTDDVYKTQFAKLGEIAQLVREHDIDAIYHGGDFFNTKNPSHKLVGDIIDWCKYVGVPIHVVIGNHDISGYNLDSVNNNAIGVLLEAGAIQKLDENVYDSAKIIFKGIHTSVDFNHSYMIDEKYNDFKKIIISHNYVIPSKDMPWNFIHPDNIQTNADLVLCGHYHVPFNYKTKTTQWINPGPLFRWKITEKDHIPKVLLIEVGDDKIVTSELTLKSVKPSSEVFNEIIAAEEKKKDQDLKQFVSMLDQTSFTTVDLENIIRNAGVNQNIDSSIIDDIIKRVKIVKEQDSCL